ncbi:MAG: carboxypeptidase regulatory-like domain-containing protein [Bryobacteraceae bacterium]
MRSVEGGGSLKVDIARTSKLTGMVTDSSNAVVPNATVVLKDEATLTTRDTASNASGVFSFEGVPPASYTLTVSAAGFTTWEERSIPLAEEARLTIPNIVLRAGQTSEEVAVVAANDVVASTDSGQASTTLNQHMISQLSLAGRDAAEPIGITPGTAPASAPSKKAAEPPPPLTTATVGKRMLRVNSSGALLLSRNAGKKWKTVEPVWQGKVVRLAVVTEKDRAAGRPVFQLTTDSGSVWVSPDGTHWNPAPIQH